MNRLLALSACAVLATVGCDEEATEGFTESAERSQIMVSPDASVTGVIRNITGRHGGVPFTAVMAITRFVGERGAVFGLAQLSQVNGVAPEAIRSLVAQPIKLPVSLAPLPSDGGVRTSRDGGAECPVLALMVKPTAVDLLGVRVELGEIDLGAKAVSGAGNLLGNVLCGVFGQLDPSGLLTGLDPALSERIVGFLNGLTGGLVEGIVDAVGGKAPEPSGRAALVLSGLDAGPSAD